jgi:pyrimidine-nucleoside phosphorylase
MTVSLTKKEFLDQVNRIGVAVIGQTGDLVPADKKIYELRDTTATVDSIPLIAASIMSKKIAAGSDAILLDVKVGNGAFMTSIEDARKLASLMVSIGTKVNRNTAAFITDMNEPLGSHIGNALEVKEAVEILQGQHKGSPLYEVSLSLGAHLLHMGGATPTPQEGMKKIKLLLESGKGVQKMAELIQAQKGDPRVAENVSLLPAARHVIPVPSAKAGFVTGFNTVKVGQCALILGAGRKKKTDPIDPAVGLITHKRIGDHVAPGEPIATIYANDTGKAREASAMLTAAVHIGDAKPPAAKLIHDIITAPF